MVCAARVSSNKSSTFCVGRQFSAENHPRSRERSQIRLFSTEQKKSGQKLAKPAWFPDNGAVLGTLCAETAGPTRGESMTLRSVSVVGILFLLSPGVRTSDEHARFYCRVVSDVGGRGRVDLLALHLDGWHWDFQLADGVEDGADSFGLKPKVIKVRL